MTHRDGFPRLSARSAWRGDAGHRKPCATQSESLGTPPFRSRRRTAGGRRKALPMSRIAGGFPLTHPLARRIARPISMGHYQRSLVSILERYPTRSRLLERTEVAAQDLVRRRLLLAGDEGAILGRAGALYDALMDADAPRTCAFGTPRSVVSGRLFLRHLERFEKQ